MLNRYLILLSIIPLGLTASDPDPLCSEFFTTQFGVRTECARGGDSLDQEGLNRFDALPVVHQVQRVESKETVVPPELTAIENHDKELWEWTFKQNTIPANPTNITPRAFELNQQLKSTRSRPRSPNLLPAPEIPYVESVEIPDEENDAQ